MSIMELVPHNGRKSFYGKAKVISENGNHTLISYETPVCRLKADGTFVRLHINNKQWAKITDTTMRHINAFARTFGISDGYRNRKWYFEYPEEEE